MKIYVWRGRGVLEDFRSGIVVINAENQQGAWDRLLKTDIRAYYTLKHGFDMVFCEADLTSGMVTPEDFPEDWKAREPEEFKLGEMPDLVIWGGS
jgi:hypothetical protein